MGLLNKVMNLFSGFQTKDAPESKSSITPIVLTTGAEGIAVAEDRVDGAKVAAIAAALHFHETENSDVRAKVAAIAAALHHHELETSQPSGIAGIAALIAAMHHHSKTKK